MSNAVLPSMPGLGWSVTKTPRFKTVTQEATSGKEVRIALMSYPIWEFTLTFEVLRGSNGFSEIQTLMGFFLARLGMWDSWLFDDPSDDTATLAEFGVGDGSTTVFQLVRSMGGFAEPIQNLNSTPTIYSNGTLVSGGAYSIGSTGIVTFTTAPTSGAILTWSGTFYFRCRFMQDTADFEQFALNLWQLKKIQFQSVKQ
jgi:uncharacterized protein (TIGR02217 family)